MIPMYLRIRPHLAPTTTPWLKVLNDTTVTQGDEEHTFKHIFPEYAGQAEVYEECIQSQVHNFLRGQDQTFFTLGATGSGKTWTTVGTEGDPGVVYRALEEVIRSNTSGMVTVSMIEIYNDRIYDLFSDRKPLAMRVDGNRCNMNYQKMGVVNYEMAREALEQGYACRAMNATQCNSQSSRSHAIVFIEAGGARLTMGDLAGNERVNDAGSTGVQLQEAGEINKSLMLFGQALQSLQQGRLALKNSKLSSILLANAAESMPVMLVTIDIYYNDKPGRQVLRYATTARKARKPIRTMDQSGNSQAFEQRIREELYRETDARLARLADAIWAR